MMDFMTEHYLWFSMLNFVTLMNLWIYRCVNVHTTKVDIENCLFWGTTGAILAAALGFIATIAVVVAITSSFIIKGATVFIMSKKGEN